MKRLENTKVNRIAQCEKELASLFKDLQDPNNFTKNKSFNVMSTEKEENNNGRSKSDE